MDVGRSVGVPYPVEWVDVDEPDQAGTALPGLIDNIAAQVGRARALQSYS